MKKTFKYLLIITISIFLSLDYVNASELPKVYFEGNITNMTSKSDERKIKITYLSEFINFDSYALIKIQGSSSLAYDKKNYTIKLYEDDDYEDKKRINVGFGDEYKYCLKANWIDKTHARNIVTAKISSDIQDKYNLFTNTPNNGLIDGFPVEIYINNEFLGLYTWNIPKGAWQFNMDEDNPNHIVLAADLNSEATSFNELVTFADWSVEAGPENDETLKKFNRVIEFIKNSTDEEFKENFNNYLNLDATLNYYVMLEFAQLIDNTSKNMLMVTYDGIIWYPSLYDLDTSWGTTWNGKELYDYKFYIIEHVRNNALWSKFERNFKNEIANRYFELKKDYLNKENVLDEFNTFINSIPHETYKQEQSRWSNIPGYDLNQIIDFLNTRIPAVDKYMTNLYDITPNISIKYSKTKYTLKPVKVTLTPNRNDITILLNGKPTYNYNYTFKENGEYKFEYLDGTGTNLGTITVKVDWIIKKELTLVAIATIIILFTSLLIYYQPKKRRKKKKKNDLIIPNKPLVRPHKIHKKHLPKTNPKKNKRPKKRIKK